MISYFNENSSSYEYQSDSMIQRVSKGERNRSSGNRRSWRMEDGKFSKNTRSGKVFSTMERVYSRIWYLGERGRLKECKRSSSKFWRKYECRSKQTRKVRYDREKKC